MSLNVTTAPVAFYDEMLHEYDDLHVPLHINSFCTLVVGYKNSDKILIFTA